MHRVSVLAAAFRGVLKPLVLPRDFHVFIRAAKTPCCVPTVLLMSIFIISTLGSVCLAVAF